MIVMTTGLSGLVALMQREQRPLSAPHRPAAVAAQTPPVVARRRGAN
ncbi:MAG: hypothetical protein ACK4MI_04295 [Brevundimonas sp.]|nr:hypothetical protein [uncultured Brevundimonas sp.]